MAFLKVNIFTSSALIGAITFVLTSVGVMAGKKLGGICGDKATALGGLILICIGIKILLEHLGYI